MQEAGPGSFDFPKHGNSSAKHRPKVDARRGRHWSNSRWCTRHRKLHSSSTLRDGLSSRVTVYPDRVVILNLFQLTSGMLHLG